jgi:CPA1 family monovalent cation:H+ antiporter
MHTFDLIAILIVLTAACSYLNVRLLKLPTTIGLMVLTLLFSALLLVIGSFVPEVAAQARALAVQFDFNEALLHGMLGFLLFAGALHVDLNDLAEQKWPIAIMASAGVLTSTTIVGVLTWASFAWIGCPLRLIDCFLFGALISPTDPIAVLALLKRIGAPKRLEVQIAGESLFNDGVGVVVFLGLLEIDAAGGEISLGSVGWLFLREAGGGALAGLLLGLIAYRLIKSVDHYRLEILLSLALVAGGYALADALHLSGPIAIVIAGLLIGNHGRSFAMSATTTEHLDRFWGLLDEFLNAVLFVMIGMEMLVLTFTLRTLMAGLISIVVVLVARVVSVGLPIMIFRRLEPFEPTMIPLLTWGGLRGGISVALALSLSEDPGDGEMVAREIILAVTYVVVVFSIVVQGLTIGPITQRLGRKRQTEEFDGGANELGYEGAATPHA